MFTAMFSQIFLCFLYEIRVKLVHTYILHICSACKLIVCHFRNGQIIPNKAIDCSSHIYHHEKVLKEKVNIHFRCTILPQNIVNIRQYIIQWTMLKIISDKFKILKQRIYNYFVIHPVQFSYPPPYLQINSSAVHVYVQPVVCCEVLFSTLYVLIWWPLLSSTVKC